MAWIWIINGLLLKIKNILWYKLIIFTETHNELWHELENKYNNHRNKLLIQKENILKQLKIRYDELQNEIKYNLSSMIND